MSTVGTIFCYWYPKVEENNAEGTSYLEGELLRSSMGSHDLVLLPFQCKSQWEKQGAQKSPRTVGSMVPQIVLEVFVMLLRHHSLLTAF